MSVTTTTADLHKWLKATSLSEQEQMSFINRFNETGKWTPQLADEFAGIILTSMKEYEEELSDFTSEMNKRNEEIGVLNARISQRYKDGLDKELEIASQELDEVNETAVQLRHAYDDYSAQEHHAKVADIMEAV